MADKRSYLQVRSLLLDSFLNKTFFLLPFLPEGIFLRHLSRSQYFSFLKKSQRVIKVEWIWGVQCGIYRRRSSVHLHYPCPLPCICNPTWLCKLEGKPAPLGANGQPSWSRTTCQSRLSHQSNSLEGGFYWNITFRCISVLKLVCGAFSSARRTLGPNHYRVKSFGPWLNNYNKPRSDRGFVYYKSI